MNDVRAKFSKEEEPPSVVTSDLSGGEVTLFTLALQASSGNRVVGAARDDNVNVTIYSIRTSLQQW